MAAANPIGRGNGFSEPGKISGPGTFSGPGIESWDNEGPSAPVVVVKIGGRVAEDDGLILSMAADLASASAGGSRVLLVHGGGITISALQKRYGVEPRFVDGLRQTAPEEMPLVDMALSGAVNKRLVRLLSRTGLKAWGLSAADGGLMRAESVTDADENRTGAAAGVDTAPLTTLWNAGFFPVCAPPATDCEGRGINVNADEAALALAAALNAANLVFVSDVPGVLENEVLINHLTPGLIEEKIAAGVIAGGMIPKTRSAADALKKGVAAVTIGDYAVSGDLEGLLSGKRGTRIDTGGYHHGT